MTRKNFQNLSRIRLKEARLLFRAKHFCGAYYLAGYAVECALKACIARKTVKYEFPDRGRVEKSHTHDLEALLKLSGMEFILDQLPRSEKEDLELNWATVKDWKEKSRYDETIDNQKAYELIQAITGRKHGVLAWIRMHW